MHCFKDSVLPQPSPSLLRPQLVSFSVLDDHAAFQSMSKMEAVNSSIDHRSLIIVQQTQSNHLQTNVYDEQQDEQRAM